MNKKNRELSEKNESESSEGVEHIEESTTSINDSEEASVDLRYKEILLDGRDNLEDLDGKIKEAKKKGNNEQEEILLGYKEKLLKDLQEPCEEVTRESLSKNIKKGLQKKGLRGINRQERIALEVKKAEKEIKENDYQKAKEILLKDLPKDIRKNLENDDEAFKEYLKRSENSQEVDWATYFRLISNGVRVDLVKDEKVSSRVWNFTKGAGKILVGSFGGILGGPIGIVAGATAGASWGFKNFKNATHSRIEVPLKDGKSVFFNSEEDFKEWANEQEESIGGDIRVEAKKRANVESKNEEGNKRNPDDIKEEIKSEQEERALLALWQNYREQGGKSKDFNGYLDGQIKDLGFSSKEELYAMTNAGYAIKEGWFGAIKVSLDGKNFVDYKKNDFQRFVRRVGMNADDNINNESKKREELIERVENGRKVFKETKEKYQIDLLERAINTEGMEETPERFAKKIDKEVEQFKRDVSPIGKEPFDAKKEFDEFKKLPKKYRTGKRGMENLNNIKEKLSTQQEALAFCRNLIEREIEKNPDIPKDEFDAWKSKLMKWFELLGQDYGFTNEHKQEAETRLNKYKERQERAQEMKNKTPDEIIKSMTGKAVTDLNIDMGRVKISVDKMSLVIEASSEIVDKLYANTKDAELIKSVNGFHYIVDNIDYVVVDNELANSTEVKKHEFQHAKNSIFKEKFRKFDTVAEKGNYENAKNATMGMIDGGADPKKIKEFETIEKEALGKYLRAEQKFALGRVKNEFMASLHDTGLEEMKTAWREMFLGKNPDNPYDYPKHIRKFSESLNPALSEELFGEKYGNKIQDAINAFYQLVDKYKENFPEKKAVEKAIDFLTYIDLEYWRPNVRRLLKQKEEQKPKLEPPVLGESKTMPGQKKDGIEPLKIKKEPILPEPEIKLGLIDMEKEKITEILDYLEHSTKNSPKMMPKIKSYLNLLRIKEDQINNSKPKEAQILLLEEMMAGIRNIESADINRIKKLLREYRKIKK